MQDDDEAVRILRRAKRLCERAVDMNPECWPALWFKASALARLRDLSADSIGDARDGFECLDHLQRLFPDYCDQHLFQRERDMFWYGAHIERVQNTVRRGCVENDESLHRDYIDAWKSTTEVLKVKPDDVLTLRLHVQLLNYFVSRGEALMLSDLLQCCENLIRLNPRTGGADQQPVHVETLRARAHAVLQYDLAERPELVIADYRQVFADLSDAIELDPRNPGLFHMRASIYFKWIDADDRMGLLMLRKCIDDSGRALETHRLAKKSKSSVSASSEGNAEPLQHDAADVRLMLGRCYLKVNNIREATTVLTEALQIRGEALPPGLLGEIKKRKTEAEELLSVEVDQAEKNLLDDLESDENRQQQKASKKQKQKAKAKEKAKKEAEAALVAATASVETEVSTSNGTSAGQRHGASKKDRAAPFKGPKAASASPNTAPRANVAASDPASKGVIKVTKEHVDRLQEMFGKSHDRKTLQGYLVRANDDINTACAWIFAEQDDKLTSLQVVPTDDASPTNTMVPTGWSQVDRSTKKKAAPKPRQPSAISARGAKPQVAGSSAASTKPKGQQQQQADKARPQPGADSQQGHRQAVSAAAKNPDAISEALEVVMPEAAPSLPQLDTRANGTPSLAPEPEIGADVSEQPAPIVLHCRRL